MDATLLLNERYTVSANIFVEMVVWRLPSATLGSKHCFKYRLAFVVDGCCGKIMKQAKVIINTSAKMKCPMILQRRNRCLKISGTT
jgi:hypothetical protein